MKIKKKLAFEVQKSFSGDPRVCKFNFSELPQLTKNRVKNDVYISPKGGKKKIHDLYEFLKGADAKKHWELRNGFCKTCWD